MIISEGVEEISGFGRAEHLTSITLPSTLRTIKDGAFATTRSLRSITIPEGVEVIESRAFENSALTSVVFPSTVDRIETAAFIHCRDLTSAVFNSDVLINQPGDSPWISENTFLYSPLNDNATIRNSGLTSDPGNYRLRPGTYLSDGSYIP